MGLFKNEKFPVSESLYESGLYLPSSIGLKKDEIVIISQVLIKILNDIKNK